MPPRNIIDDLDSKRLDRVARFCVIIGAAWAFFGLYYVVQGVWFTATICAVEVICATVATIVALRSKPLRKQVADCFLLFSTMGIVVESLGSGLSMSTTPHFMCCVGLFAAHQTGMRSAFRWTLAILFAQALIYLILDPSLFPVYRSTTAIERFLVPAAVTMIIYALSHQAENSFDRYAVQYIEATDRLEDQAKSLRLAEKVAKVGHWRWRTSTKQFTLSKEARSICGLQATNNDFSEDEFVACLTRISQIELRKQLEVCQQAPHNFELEVEFKPGHSTECAKYIGFSEFDSRLKIKRIFGVIKDETETHKAQVELNQKAEELRNLAQYDQLSGLANRRTFRLQLAAATKVAELGDHQFALLLIDLDGFKEINDTMGHAAGDEVLRGFAIRLESVLKELKMPGSVARLGGDEFTVILEKIDSVDEIAQVAERIGFALETPFTHQSDRLHVGASIGAAVFPTDTRDLTELLSFADTAMYEAKIEKCGLRRYDREMTRKIVERREIDLRLQTALRDNQFFIDYQPLFSADNKISGVEGLIRWNRDGEIISPAVFIPHLESSQAIIEVGRWGLFEACNQGRDWLEAGTPVRVSVNISAVHFRHPEFVSCVRDALMATGFPPNLLDIEITESVVVGNMAAAEATIRKIKEMGVQLSIDDFGTGYSSLSYLKHLPFDRLKIDRAFVKDYPDHDDGTLAKTIIVLAHGLNMEVVAEGVETKAQHEFLLGELCDEFQGFLLAKPESAEAITRRLEVTPLTYANSAMHFQPMD